MKNWCKNEKGSMAVYVVVTLLSFIMILAGIFMNAVSIRKNQLKTLPKIKQVYEKPLENKKEIYEEQVALRKSDINEENKLIPADKGKLVTGENKTYEDEDGKTAIIPGGFCVVKDSTEHPEDKNTVESGLVISDVAEDDLDNSKHGNQFVWIPVEDYSKFHLIEGYNNRSLQIKLIAANPSKEAGAETTAGTPLAQNNTAGSSESIAMYSSVQINKGFYIGRFEAGIAGTTDNYSLFTKTVADGTISPLVQKGVGTWNSIPWGGSYSDTSTSDQLPGDDTQPGAVVVARRLYPESDKIHKVTSTLCYGVQWDAALNFIDPNYEKAEGDLTSFVANSVDKGNYSGGIAVTGSNQSYQQKHIYDLAGNVYEWTMEAFSTNDRVIRGGNYYGVGNISPASFRSNDTPELESNNIRLSPSFVLVTP